MNAKRWAGGLAFVKNATVDPRIRLAIARSPHDAPRGAVIAFCTEHEISRMMFYHILKRAHVEGQAAALEPHSRRPKIPPNVTSETLKDQAIAMRETLAESGWDCGPVNVFDQKLKLGMHSRLVAVLAKIFRERGRIVLTQQNRRCSSFRSGRYPTPNVCWELDATEYVLQDGRKCMIFQLLDKHTWVAVAPWSLVRRMRRIR